MTSGDGLAILPLIVLAAAAVAVMLAVAVRRHHGLAAAMAAIGMIAAGATLAISLSLAPRQVTPLIIIDGFAIFYLALVIAAALAVVLMSYGYLSRREPRSCEEYYILLLTATLGAAVLAASNHFAAFFLGLEMLSISLLGLIAYPRSLEKPLEAGLKYLILSGISSAFLLFGIALTYAEQGTLLFATANTADGRAPGILWLSGVAMILTGIGFKLSVVPFHMWAPDVYEGAPAPITAFVAVVSKSAVFALLLRYFIVAGHVAPGLSNALAAVAVLSMIVGNLLALLQDNIKRILAYSSISHLGYALVALLASGASAIEAVSVYLVAYAVTTLGAFGVISAMSGAELEHDADRLEDYRGLLWRRPAMAVILAAMLLSLAGIPITAGFFAKFYALGAGVGAGLAVPVAALIIGSIIGLYYYLRIIVVMAAPLELPTPQRTPRVHALDGVVLLVLTLLLVAIGLYPSPLINSIRGSAAILAAGASTQQAARP